MSQNKSLPKSSFLPEIGGLSLTEPHKPIPAARTNGEQVVSIPGISVEDEAGNTPILRQQDVVVKDAQPRHHEGEMLLKSPDKARLRVSSPVASVGSSSAGIKSSESSKDDITVCDFPKDILTDLEESFCVFDQTGDGCINPGKLHKIANYAMRDTTTEAEVQDQILEIDINGDGTVEFDEYFDMMKSRVLKPPTDKDIEKAFQVFDVNQSGGIETDDLFQLMQHLGSSLTFREVKDMVKSVSGASSKSVSMKDFKHLAQGKHPENLGAILSEQGLEEDVIRVIPMADKTVAIDCFPELLDAFL